MTSAPNPALIADYCLRLGDDALVLGQRLGELLGHSPELELDMATSNLALDLFGQAQLLLAEAARLQDRGQDADALAFTRDVLAFRNCLLVEQPNEDFGHVIVRQFLFSTYHHSLLTALKSSAHGPLSDIAQKCAPEIAHHVKFARNWLVRLGDGTAESRERVTSALAVLWKFTDELFETSDDLAILVAAGVAADPAALRAEWDAAVDGALSEATLERPEPVLAATGGRRGQHSEHLGHILSEMQFMQRAYPGLSW